MITIQFKEEYALGNVVQIKKLASANINCFIKDTIDWIEKMKIESDRIYFSFYERNENQKLFQCLIPINMVNTNFEKSVDYVIKKNYIISKVLDVYADVNNCDNVSLSKEILKYAKENSIAIIDNTIYVLNQKGYPVLENGKCEVLIPVK